MKKAMKSSLFLLLIFVALIGITASAAVKSKTVKSYDSEGNRVYGSSRYYEGDVPMFGRNCYFYDEDGNKTSAYGCPIYYYNGDGELYEGSCYYDAGGNAVRSYRNNGRGGCCRR